jgi:hypothetical protein
MKALIAALALVTLIASPTFARPAARASPQAEFVFPTDQQLCQSGRTDFCAGGDTLFGSGIAALKRLHVIKDRSDDDLNLRRHDWCFGLAQCVHHLLI